MSEVKDNAGKDSNPEEKKEQSSAHELSYLYSLALEKAKRLREKYSEDDRKKDESKK